MNGPIPEVSIVIPCLNEAGNAALYEKTLFEHLDRASFESEVIFSDGGSTDGTAGILGGLAARRPGVRLLGTEKFSSFSESLARALPACRGKYIVFLEADLSFSPADIPKLLAAAKRGGCDCVCGSPFLGNFEGPDFFRNILTRSANLLLRLRFGVAVTSYTQIFKLFRASALRTLDFENKGFTLDAELTAKCLARGFSVAEVPVTMRARSAGSSKLRALPETLACLRLIVKGVR